MSLLDPLKKSLKSFGVYLLPFPTEDTLPGTILDHNTQVIQDLRDLRRGKTDFFAPLGKVTLGAPVPASAVLNSHTYTVSAGGGIGVGLPSIASVEAGVKHASTVTLVIGDLYERKLVVGAGSTHESNLDALDYLLLCNQNLEFLPFMHIAEMMRRRRNGWPTTRWVDLVESVVYAKSISFQFHTETSIDLEAALTAAVQVDVEAGVGVAYTGNTTVTWTEGLKIPIGFKPVRYAWNSTKKSFALAWL